MFARRCRLKVLKDEIKKPYFLQLKEFLWSEGVHGADEDYTRLKIYPSRACALVYWQRRVTLFTARLTVQPRTYTRGPTSHLLARSRL